MIHLLCVKQTSLFSSNDDSMHKLASCVVTQSFSGSHSCPPPPLCISLNHIRHILTSVWYLLPGYASHGHDLFIISYNTTVGSCHNKTSKIEILTLGTSGLCFNVNVASDPVIYIYIYIYIWRIKYDKIRLMISVFEYAGSESQFSLYMMHIKKYLSLCNIHCVWGRLIYSSPMMILWIS